MEVCPAAAATGRSPTPGAEGVLFVVEGEVAVDARGRGARARARRLSPICPPAAHWTLRNTGAAPVRFHWIRKAYEAVEGIDAPPAVRRQRARIEPIAWMPDTDGTWATTRFVDPDDLRHDMHVNIVTFEPGAVIPFEETHVMEHGLYVLEGKAVYRLNRDWVEVEAGDFMWLRAFCPQACYAGGPGRFRYLLYKDVNRHMKLS